MMRFFFLFFAVGFLEKKRLKSVKLEARDI
jgi:hypothetical protein